MIIPVIIGTTGRVTNGLNKNLEAKPGKYSIDSLQKKQLQSHLEHHTLRGKYWSVKLSGGSHRRFNRSTKTKMPVTSTRDKEIIIIIIIIIMHTPFVKCWGISL
jgi:hypothetical protein